jgi:hypothetical protein
MERKKVEGFFFFKNNLSSFEMQIFYITKKTFPFAKLFLIYQIEVISFL